jgi:hypothetical protein
MADEKWLIMAYFAGDNDLSDEAVFALTEMKKVDTADRIKIVAQFDPKDRRMPTHRYEINKNGAAGATGGNLRPAHGRGKLADDIIFPMEKGTVRFPGDERSLNRTPGLPHLEDKETDTGDPRTLFDFISWSVEQSPAADRYMLILSGHGAGIEEHFFLRDENPASTLSLNGFRSVFEAVKSELGIEIDILGMDNCLMSMVEICHELNGLVKYIVGSEGYATLTGWPYQNILKAIDADLQTEGRVAPESVARRIVEEFIDYYTEYSMSSGLSVDISALNVSASVEVANKLKALTVLLNQELEKPAFQDQIVLAHWRAQSYNGELFVDLKDFCDLLAERSTTEELAQACEDVRGAVTRMVLQSCYTGIDYQYSFGASIYFPWATVTPEYQYLAFAKETGANWFQFLTRYTEKTRREPRGTGTNESLFMDVSGIRKTPLDGRKTPLDGRGTGEVIHSMRNPPLSLIAGGVSDCLRGNQEVIERFEELPFK